MRRYVVAGLVPCPPEELASHLLDASRASRIWPQVADGQQVQAEDGWWEGTPTPGSESATEVVVIRFRRVESGADRGPEVLASIPGAGEHAVHRFLPASGGCLWTIESHAQPGEREPWHRFARRRLRSREAIEAMVDAAAGYFASQR